MGPRIKTPNGQELDPVYISASNLVRLGNDEYTAVMRWVTEQREARAERARVLEEEQAEMAATFRKDAELRHPDQVAWVRRNL
jgi:hypothetical protein